MRSEASHAVRISITEPTTWDGNRSPDINLRSTKCQGSTSSTGVFWKGCRRLPARKIEMLIKVSPLVKLISSRLPLSLTMAGLFRMIELARHGTALNADVIDVHGPALADEEVRSNAVGTRRHLFMSVSGSWLLQLLLPPAML